MFVRRALVSAGIVLLAALFAGAGEPQPPAKAAQPKPDAEIAVKPPFDKLYSSKYHRERVAALVALLPRAEELSEAAKAEAARLRGLPAPEEGSAARGILDFAIGSLEAIAAEPEVIKKWKRGLPAAAQKSAEKVVALDCRDKPIAEVLRRASAGWGVSIEMSPAAWRAAGALDVSLEGSPTLGQFLDWLCAEQGLVCGASGERVVLVLPASLRLQENIEKAKDPKKP